MEAAEGIVNKVAHSGLVSFDLEDLYPEGERVLLDIKDQLYEGMILREKDFREFLKNHDWEQYRNKNVAITCTEDAIVPTWAFMLLVTRLEPVTKNIVYGDLDALEEFLWKEAIDDLDREAFRDAKVVIKGCSKLTVPIYAYTELTRKLRPTAASIMFGEPCSTVPLYKKPKE